MLKDVSQSAVVNSSVKQNAYAATTNLDADDDDDDFTEQSNVYYRKKRKSNGEYFGRSHIYIYTRLSIYMMLFTLKLYIYVW